MQLVIRGPIKVFDKTDDLWHYVLIPPTLLPKIAHVRRTRSGYIKASLKLNECTWDGAFMPMARGNFYIPIPESVLEAEDLVEDDVVTVAVLIH